MASVHVAKQIDERLADLARQTGKNKAFYVKKALLDFLEDEEDIALAETRIAKPEMRLSSKQVKHELGI